MINILHIAAHYGGGVGTVVRAWSDNDRGNRHRFTHLNDSPANGGELFRSEMVGGADVVICHVWNHPSTFEFLVNSVLPPCRLAIWYHVSGLFAPDVFCAKLCGFPDRFIFTTPISLDVGCLGGLSVDVRSKLGVIWSTYDMKRFGSVVRSLHDGFNVGFAGTTDFGKLHPRFIEMCGCVKSPVRFVVASTDSQDHLRSLAESLGIGGRFDFRGRVPDIVEHLSSCDVFGYPLQPAHFGSCEQAIGEAMICGAVPVVLGNRCERSIVEHMVTGVVADSVEGYSGAIDYLFENRGELGRMSSNAMRAARSRYDVCKMVSEWGAEVDYLMGLGKTEKCWGSGLRLPPALVYAFSLGSVGKPLVDYFFSDSIGDVAARRLAEVGIRELFSSNSAFSSDRKGGVRQYLRHYPGDRYLREWSSLAGGV